MMKLIALLALFLTASMNQAAFAADPYLGTTWKLDCRPLYDDNAVSGEFQVSFRFNETGKPSFYMQVQEFVDKDCKQPKLDTATKGAPQIIFAGTYSIRENAPDKLRNIVLEGHSLFCGVFFGSCDELETFYVRVVKDEAGLLHVSDLSAADDPFVDSQSFSTAFRKAD